jgi:hypothetical protein
VHVADALAFKAEVTGRWPAQVGSIKAEQCHAGGIDLPRRRCSWEAPWRALLETVRMVRG